MHSIHVILLHAIPAVLHAISALTRFDQDLRYGLRIIKNLDKKMNRSKWAENEDAWFDIEQPRKIRPGAPEPWNPVHTIKWIINFHENLLVIKIILNISKLLNKNMKKAK